MVYPLLKGTTCHALLLIAFIIDFPQGMLPCSVFTSDGQDHGLAGTWNRELSGSIHPECLVFILTIYNRNAIEDSSSALWYEPNCFHNKALATLPPRSGEVIIVS
jgi:hypothetical protein